MDFNRLIARAQAIILKPKEEWVKIKAEPTTVKDLFTGYVMILAAIPAIAQFIGNALIGHRVPYFGWVRQPLTSALLFAIFSYVVSVATVYVLGIIIKALAPSFSSKPDEMSALKLAAYSMTPGWIAGVLYIIPFLGILATLGSLYGLYVLYLGFDGGMMDTPKEKVMGYTVVTIVAAAVLIFVLGLILAGIFLTRAAV